MPTTDRENFLREFEEGQARWRDDPLAFCREVLHSLKPWSRQVEIMQPVTTHDEVTRRSLKSLLRSRWNRARALPEPIRARGIDVDRLHDYLADTAENDRTKSVGRCTIWSFQIQIVSELWASR